MLKFFMLKIIFIFHILFFISLSANEPILAILRNVNSNDMQEFNIGNYNFYCHPYGVVTIERMYNKSKKGSLCKKTIEALYKKDPDLKYLADRNLYIEQRYHVNFKDTFCILYSNGQLTWSEKLLKKGAAILKPKFNDKEFVYSFKQAEISAKIKKYGLWDSDIQKNCKLELEF